MADDAIRLDTTELDADAAFAEARGIVEQSRGDAD
jgi:cytidylate kinase